MQQQMKVIRIKLDLAMSCQLTALADTENRTIASMAKQILITHLCQSSERKSPILDWIESDCEVITTSSGKSHDLYHSYCEWAFKNSIIALGSKQWVNHMKAMGFHRYKSSMIYFRGISLKLRDTVAPE